jgi:hypothetical protein
MKAKQGMALAVMTLALGAAGDLLAPPATAADVRAPREGSDQYGSPADSMPYEKDVRLSPNQRGVGVWRRETVRFVTPEGREFRWRFDTLAQITVFPLSAIAPEGVSVPAATMVYVNGDQPTGGRGR